MLRLSRVPQRIECFDISTIQGDKTVAAMAVFEKGEPAKNRYRRYEIKNVGGQDDFGAMREALHRRYTRAIPIGHPTITWWAIGLPKHRPVGSPRRTWWPSWRTAIVRWWSVLAR